MDGNEDESGQPRDRLAVKGPSKVPEIRRSRRCFARGSRPNTTRSAARRSTSAECKLDGRAVSLEGLEVTRGEMDRLFDVHPAAVLRPDRYVFGVVDEEWDLDRLLALLGRKLALR